jgi:hypothetical protein
VAARDIALPIDGAAATTEGGGAVWPPPMGSAMSRAATSW